MRHRASVLTALVALLGCDGPASGGELASVAAPTPWTISFTTYGWMPWISGDLTVKGRSFDVDVTAGQVLDALDWSTIPAWFSYAEARNGRLSLFNDVVYAKLAGSRDFAKAGPLGAVTLSGNVGADYGQTIVELGATYEIWSAGTAMGPAGLDIVAGGRYWHQSATVSADLSATVNLDGLILEGSRVLAKSGSVDWVDPFIGVRLRQAIAEGQSLKLRADVGGFDVGSDVTWQVVASFDFQICTTDLYAIDGYVGYRALSVDYSEGSGFNRYEFDAVMQGPVVGASLRF
jgi:hypothetical protein